MDSLNTKLSAIKFIKNEYRTATFSDTNLASDFFLCQKILAFIIENNVNFLRAVATDIWSKHDVVRCLSMHVLLVEVAGKQLHIATSAVNLLLMFHTKLYHQRLSLVAEWLVKLG